MIRLRRYLTAALLVVTGGEAPAGSATHMNWSDLPDPAAQVFEDPFRDLNPEQFDDILFVLRLRARLEKDLGTPEEREKRRSLLSATEDAQSSDGIDVDWLLSQREKVVQLRKQAGVAGNSEFDDQVVTLSGYAIPAPQDETGRPVAYLVPKYGMCSHIPPPPPNQMVRVLLSDDWAPQDYYEPVRLTGRLSIEPTEHRIVVIDGIVPMQATFLLDASEAEELENEIGTSESGLSLLERFHAVGDRKTRGAKAFE